MDRLIALVASSDARVNTLFQAGARVQERFERHGWKFCFVGLALRTRVLLLRTPDGCGIDVALGAMPFASSAIERSSNAELVPGATLRACSAEDLIVHKAFAARPQDWVDIGGVILKQRGLLHWPQIWSNLGELAELKEAPELLVELDRVATRTESVVGPFPHARP